MKTQLLLITLILALLGTPMTAIASDISNAQYYATILVSNNSTATTNVATTANISTTNLINGNYLNATATNAVVRSSSGADVPFMPGYTPDSVPWCFWVPSMGANSYLNYILYTANSTGGAIRYFPGPTGMETADSATLEVGDNFTIEQSGYFDTTAVGANITSKGAAFRIYISGTSNVTATIPDYALHFDNVNDYTTQGTVWDTPSANVSIELWFKPTDTFDSTDVVDDMIFQKINVNNEDRIWAFLESDNGRLFCYFEHNNGGSQNIQSDATSWTGGQWYYMALTYDGTTWRMYIDGTLQADTQAMAGFMLNGNDTDFTLGADTTGAQTFDGDMDELRLSDITRSQAEVTATWNSGIGQSFTLDSDTTMLWHMNENTGANVGDSTANNYDGTIQAGTWTIGRFPALVTATGLSSGEYTITSTANTTHFWIDVDSVLADSCAVLPVFDNSDNWTFCQAAATPYAGSSSNYTIQTIHIDSILQQHIIWEYATTFTDQSGHGHDATPTFRSASSDADVSAIMTAFLPIAEAKAPDYALGEAPAFIDADALTGNVTGTFGTTPGTGTGTFPLAGVITAMADATSTPAQLPLLIIAVFIILAASLSFSAIVRRHGSGTILVKIIAIAALMGIFVALGDFAIDFWMILVFLIIAIAAAFASRQLGWT